MVQSLLLLLYYCLPTTNSTPVTRFLFQFSTPAPKQCRFVSLSLSFSAASKFVRLIYTNLFLGSSPHRWWGESMPCRFIYPFFFTRLSQNFGNMEWNACDEEEEIALFPLHGFVVFMHPKTRAHFQQFWLVVWYLQINCCISESFEYDSRPHLFVVCRGELWPMPILKSVFLSSSSHCFSRSLALVEDGNWFIGCIKLDPEWGNASTASTQDCCSRGGGGGGVGMIRWFWFF